MTVVRNSEPLWTEERWRNLDGLATEALRRVGRSPEARRAVVRYARGVIRSFSSSFFIVTRFLPERKRQDVEILYANVRYPDEVVDTLRLSPEERLRRLEMWEEAYEAAVSLEHPIDAIEQGVPAFLAAFGSLVRAHGIPHNYYRAFLAAMRADVEPRRYADMRDLIENYVYGSAIVVGGFLTYIFGPAPGHSLEEALSMARALGTALQMTNFLRDVGEDLSRGRIYLPLDRTTAAGVEPLDPACPEHRKRLDGLVAEIAAENDKRYAYAEARLEVFSPDVRSAVSACIRVYRLLNRRAMAVQDVLDRRISVPFREKFGALPFCKYWVLPYSYLVERW